MENIFKTTINSPVGFLEITSDQDSLLSVSFVSQKNQSTINPPWVLLETVKQLTEYFAGTRKKFEIELHLQGTAFQTNVWEKVKGIPYGKTASYLDIAIQTGSLKNTRAVGMANGKNPIPIIIPCHRVVGKNGKLTGYSGGMDKKKWLIVHELKNSENNGRLF